MNIIPRWLFTSPRIANWMGRSWGQLAARTRGSRTNTNTINFLSPQSYKYRKYWAFIVDFWRILRLFSVYQNASLPATQITFLDWWTWTWLNRHTPHGVVHTCCLCLMLRLKGVIQPRLISPSCYSRRLKVTAPSNHRPERVQNLFISNFHPMHEKF